MLKEWLNNRTAPDIVIGINTSTTQIDKKVY